MAFNEKERAIIDWGKKNGKTRADVERAIVSYRTGVKPEKKAEGAGESKKPYLARVIDKVSDSLNTRTERFGAIKARPEEEKPKMSLPSQYTPSDPSIPKGSSLKKNVQLFGQGAGLAADALEATVTEIPGIKKGTEAVATGINWLATSDKSPIKMLGEQIGKSEALQEAVRLYDTDQDFKDTVDGVANIARLSGDVEAAVSGVNFVKNVSSKLISKTKGALPKNKLVQAEKGFEKGGTTSNTVDMHDNYIKTGDYDIAKVYKDPTAKIYQPDIAKQIVSDGVNNLKIHGFPELAAKYEKMFGDYTKVTPDQVLTNGKLVINNAGGLPPQVTEGLGGISRIPENKAMSTAIEGTWQKGQELLERIPRAVDKVQESMQNSAIRAEKIRNSPPAVRDAIKSGLDDRIINTVTEADAPTIKAYKEMLDLADSTGAKLKPAQRPEIVAGKVAGEQYKTIDTQRKAVGQKIGETVDKLSKTQSVNMLKGNIELRDILSKQGIKFTDDGINFSGSKFTPAERLRITELYKLASEGGDNLTPRQIYDKDQLFSKLQREARMEGIGEILIDLAEGEKKSLFRVFRDVYSQNLDTLSPEIKALNKEYRKLVTLQDDVENSIVKGGNFETTGKIDPAEFAQTNLRRILSDAQSAASYRDILESMDKLSRELGYTGARADDLITFATELRKLYPDSIPATSFSGGIRTGLVDLAQKALDVGKPGTIDQQRALRMLLQSLLVK